MTTLREELELAQQRAANAEKRAETVRKASCNPFYSWTAKAQRMDNKIVKARLALQEARRAYYTSAEVQFVEVPAEFFDALVMKYFHNGLTLPGLSHIALRSQPSAQNTLGLVDYMTLRLPYINRLWNREGWL